MIIALFGVTCVGKTTVGKIIAEKLQYDFYDLDAEIISFFSNTIDHIQNSCICRNEYESKKAEVLKSILNKCCVNTIIAISPIYYTLLYKKMFRDKNVFSIVLHDSPENIARRMIDTDENDNIIESCERDIKADLKVVKYFISRYKKAFSKIENKYNVGGKSALEAANEIIGTIIMPLLLGDSSKHNTNG